MLIFLLRVLLSPRANIHTCYHQTKLCLQPVFSFFFFVTTHDSFKSLRLSLHCVRRQKRPLIVFGLLSRRLALFLDFFFVCFFLQLFNFHSVPHAHYRILTKLAVPIKNYSVGPSVALQLQINTELLIAPTPAPKARSTFHPVEQCDSLYCAKTVWRELL